MTCEKCGAALKVGDFPFCPHEPAHGGVQGDEMDYVDWNLGPEPIHITSRAQRAALMRERGLREAIWHIPAPGSDQSPVTRSWDTPCAYTLENARILVSRQGERRDPDAGRLDSLQVGWEANPVKAFVKAWAI